MKHYTVIVNGNYVSLKAKDSKDALKKARQGKGKLLANNLYWASAVRVKLGFMTYGEIDDAKRVGAKRYQ